MANSLLPKQPNKKSSHAREHIAAHCAKLIAEEGIEDYAFAKRKAARQLGLDAESAMPSNEEIDAALRSYQTLFQQDEHSESLRILRQHAYEVMQFLSEFQPYLTGTVLSGIAGRHAVIELEIFTDNSKDLEIFFLNHNIAYTHTQIHSTLTCIEFLWNEDVPIRLNVFEARARHQLKRNGHQAGHPARVDLNGLQILLATGV